MSQLTAYDKFIQQALKYGFSLYGLPKTGQTISHSDYDDGDLEKGYPTKGPRFTDNGDGTVTDNATGLMWVKESLGAGCNNGNVITWFAALTWVNGLTFAGYSDWRMPNIKELPSIINYGLRYPAVDTVFFPECKSAEYWSSTTSIVYSLFAWTINFSLGEFSGAFKTSAKLIRPVRGGA